VVFEVVFVPELEVEPAPAVVAALEVEAPDGSDEPEQYSCAAKHERRWLSPAQGPSSPWARDAGNWRSVPHQHPQRPPPQFLL